MRNGALRLDSSAFVAWFELLACGGVLKAIVTLLLLRAAAEAG
jgi:hypothetical protein